MHQEILFPREKAELYPLLAQQIAALAEDSQPLSTLANAAALLYEALPDINWAGFYLASGDMLHLGPFQGPGRKLFCRFGWMGASLVCWTLIRQA